MEKSLEFLQEMTAPRRRDLIDLTLQPNLVAKASFQNRAVLDNAFEHVNVASTSQPQRSRLQLPPFYVNKPITLTHVPRTLKHTIRHYGKDAKTFVLTEFTWGEGPAHLPGTAEYYKSTTFREKGKQAGKDQVTGKHPAAMNNTDDIDDDTFCETNAKSHKKTSLVMIFGRTNVRRASDMRMAHMRLQRYNRRMRFWRRVNGEEALFDWD
ncbi:Nn.00g117460.m01.CDS01 [Neocucurbitaria sp. VM-36]